MAIFYVPIPVAATTFTSDSHTNGSVPASFDAFLYKPINPGEQLKLTIKLRIKLRRLPPKLIPLQRDFDRKPFWTSPWSGADWQRFIHAAAAQADMWNDKFWLLPPTTFTMFSEFDWVFDGFPNQARRPNIRCELDVDFDATDDAHRTIDVANLNTNFLLGQPLNPGTFRSDALLWDSLDSVPWAFPYGQGPGEPKKHYVIAHELGHAMGLGHIGTILKTPLCELAIMEKNAGIKPSDPDAEGGSNSFYCYGRKQGIPIVGNIMGAGDSFTVENARPWLWAIGSMRQRPLESLQWRVVMSDPGPGTWIRK